jgi:hypothetical protein
MACLFAAPSALGQAETAGPPESGLAVGRAARLHLLLGIEGRYDSLAGQGTITSGAGASAANPGDIILHVRPGLRLHAPGPSSDLDVAASVDWTQYSGWLGPTADLGFLGANFRAAYEMGRSGPWRVRFSDSYARTDRTTNPALGVGTLTDTNNFGMRASYAPGGGSLEASAGYEFGLEAYELTAAGTDGCTTASCSGTRYSDFGSYTNRFTLGGRWRFLPKTAIVLDASFAFRNYNDETLSIPSHPLRVEVGLVGLVTEKLRVTLRAGWADTLAARGADFGGPVGEFQIGWDPTPTIGLTAGLLATVEPVSDLFGWYNDYRLFTSGRLQLFGRLQLLGQGRMDLLAFANSGRTDLQAALDLQVEVELFRLLRAALGTTLTVRSSSAEAIYSYQRAEVFLRLTVAY